MMDLTPYYPGYGHEEINGVTYVWEFVNRSTGMLKYGVNGEELKSVFLNDTSSEFKEYIQRIAFKESTSEQAKQDRAHRRAMDILEGKLLDENDVPITPRDFILNTFKTQHIGDIETAEGILLGTANQSIKNSKGIQTGVFGESGKGKSHAGRAMMHLHPAKYYLIESLSDKALFYMASDELRPGMTIFSDDVRISDGLEDIIKRSTSQFQDETTHRVATKENRDGKLISKKYTIPPRINWLLTSVDAQGSEQLVNRQIGFGVDESSAQDDEIIKFEALKAMEGKPEFEETEDVITCREIILNIKEDESGAQRLFDVTIPFALRIQWFDKANRRNYPIFLDMIKGYAALNFKRRERTIDGKLIATEDDYRAAARLYNTRGGFQKLHIREREKEMLQLITENGGELSTRDLMEKMNFSDTRIAQLGDRLKKVLPQFAIEKRSVSVGDPDDSTKRTGTTRNYYCYHGKITLDMFGSVTSLEPDDDDHSITPSSLQGHSNTPKLGVMTNSEKRQNESLNQIQHYNNNIINNNNNNNKEESSLQGQNSRERRGGISLEKTWSDENHSTKDTGDKPISSDIDVSGSDAKTLSELGATWSDENNLDSSLSSDDLRAMRNSMRIAVYNIEQSGDRYPTVDDVELVIRSSVASQHHELIEKQDKKMITETLSSLWDQLMEEKEARGRVANITKGDVR